MNSTWQKNLNKLIQFKNEFGHLNVPKSYPDRQLARLVTTIRQQNRYRTLTSDRELALLRLGFDFEPMQSQWLKSYAKIVEYYRLKGHASPNRRSENEHERALADWVHRMHKLIRKNDLDEDKVDKLKLLNIDGKPSEHKIGMNGLPSSFDQYLIRLRSYIENNGATIDSQMHESSLYNWILLQRKRINASLISPLEYSSLIKTGLKFEEQSSTVSAKVIKFG